jgi:hypothetical protein
MRSDKTNAIASMTTRQKVTALVLVLIIIIVIWQVSGLFSSKGKGIAPMTPANQSAMSMKGNAPATPPQQMRPQQANLMKLQEPASQRELELIKLQQETQAKYIAALNELQMLKVSREIAETNQAIVKAKLATVTDEKNIVTMLSPQQPQIMPGQYSRGLVNPTSGANVPSTAVVSPIQPEINYTVISVSQLQYKWGAVLGYQGNLYNVFVGDILPPDGSKVISINKSGVELEKNGVMKKLSLVPII